MEILHEDNGKNGSFFIMHENKRVGEMTYTHSGNNRILIEHTEVGPELAGQGAGKKMLMELVAYARNNQFKVVPICPFAASVFDKVKEIGDVL